MREVRSQLSEMQSWFSKICNYYRRPVFVSSDIISEFRDCVPLLCTFHCLTPPNDRQNMFKIFWKPKT